MIPDAEKQLIKMNRREMFMIENNLGLFFSWRILVLAIIIMAAIQILSIISTEDIRSTPENDEIDIYEKEEKFIKTDKGAIIIKADVIIHQ